MKRAAKMTGAALGLVLWLLAPQTAWSFYNPQTGRWLSRDPIEEPGANLLRQRSTAAIESPGKHPWPPSRLTRAAYPKDLSRRVGLTNEGYRFIANATPNMVDNLGLDVLVPAGNCGNPCETYALSQLQDWLGWSLGGGVVCCGGRKYACAWLFLDQFPVLNARAIEIIRSCRVAHETTHFDQTSSCCDNGFMYRPDFLYGVPPKTAECVAHRAEVDCLANAVLECGEDTECTAVVVSEWSRQMDEMEDGYCR